MTFKKALGYGLVGIPIGIAISTSISLFISLLIGEYMPTANSLIEMTGSVVSAALFQYLASAALGFVSGFGCAIWQLEDWSILKRTIIHFFLLSLTFMPISIVCGWVKLHPLSILLYFGFFIVIYLVIWFVQYQAIKRKISKMNARLREKNS